MFATFASHEDAKRVGPVILRLHPLLLSPYAGPEPIAPVVHTPVKISGGICSGQAHLSSTGHASGQEVRTTLLATCTL